MKKRILSFLLVIVLIGSIMPTVYAASTATIIRAVDNNPSLGRGTYTVVITFKSDGNIGKSVVASNCDECYFLVQFPKGTTWSSVSASGASSGSTGSTADGSPNYRRYLGKNFMTSSSDTLTITFTGVTALPYACRLAMKEVSTLRSYTGDMKITVNGAHFYTKNDLDGDGGIIHNAYSADTYPSPTSSTINLSTSSVTAPLNSTSNITYA